ncbi:MAG: hypothetical protein LBS36_07675 [Oscillospiraceae bacterium]|nr:hypothetical protein [Oscillospiraceae bacterium]
MSRYIDAEQTARTLLSITRVYDSKYQKGFYDGIDRALEAIQDTPTADLAPIRRGKWDYKTVDHSGNALYRCSACKGFVRGTYDFCPNCGADMRKEPKNV